MYKVGRGMNVDKIFEKITTKELLVKLQVSHLQLLALSSIFPNYFINIARIPFPQNPPFATFDEILFN